MWPTNTLRRIARSGDLLELLGKETRPLICPPMGIGLIFSAKSACTTAVLWFFAVTDMLNEAVAYDPWPHKFRIEKLLRSEVYKEWLACDLAALSWIRVIRDPYRRAVSSYRHVLRHAFEDDRIFKALGVSVADRGLSFVEFLEYLACIDVTACNPHLMQQWHPIEGRVRVAVVNADRNDLLRSLNAFAQTGDASCGMLEREIARIGLQHNAVRLGPNGDCSKAIFNCRRASTNDKWPDYGDFLSQTTRAVIEKIYAKDFEVYAEFL